METRERWRGVLVLVIGIGLIAMNEAMISSSGRFYPKMYALAGACLPLGLYGSAFGLAGRETQASQPMHYKVATIGLGLLGLLAGIAYAFHLEE